MAASRGETPGFLADLTNRHPFNDNAELLWHCGPFPRSLAKKDSKPSVIRCQSQFAIKGGDITLVRFGSLINGEYRLFADEAVGVEGPPTKGNYVWVETENWPRWERKFIIVAQLSGRRPGGQRPLCFGKTGSPSADVWNCGRRPLWTVLQKRPGGPRG